MPCAGPADVRGGMANGKSKRETMQVASEARVTLRR
jgi:hypothetical protein